MTSTAVTPKSCVSGKIFLDFSPYTSEPDCEEDSRRSQFYFAGMRAVYEAGPYEE
jgi:hypothetical protein